MSQSSRHICQMTTFAIEDIFFGTSIGTREDAIQLLREENPSIPDHIETCSQCDQALSAQLLTPIMVCP